MLIQRNPDIYLSELKKHLADNMGVNPSLSTISRVMARIGFTRKTVRVY